MKTKPFLLPICSVLFLLFVSCTADDNLSIDEGDLRGVWELAEFKVFDDATNTALPNAEFILSELLAIDCKILQYNFRADGTLITESTIHYIHTDPEIIACPSGVSTTFTGSWELNGSKLTLGDDASGSSDTIDILLAKNTLKIAGEELDPETLAGSEFVLRRR
ncbi:hypothetical protein FGM00_01340 [Aggregatimonas sangjinii]|uniref:Lipocalin-like domain-containing protein n=1 Tax=Aggregatimonas sangjinii TaxID=2583587 RepID=A0A5B7SN38_9FLAO|nr:hypothetical protein [Aggregatimonas sangjinii]QCW98828.1 hypothetical protein FGM00_01340 [Aggregatimonas sangjinii]